MLRRRVAAAVLAALVPLAPPAAAAVSPPGPGGADADQAAAAVTSFVDVPPGHPFHDDVAWLVAEGITSGYADGTFRPTEPVTRQAMAAFLHRRAGSPPVPAPTTRPFTDVPPDHPFATEIAWMKSTGLSTGYDDGTFRPGTRVARDAMAAFLHRADGAPRVTVPEWTTFPDVGLGHPFAGPVEWLAEQWVTNGYADGTFRPSDAISRGAMAAFLHRMAEGGDVTVVGTGTPASCTSAALAAAVRDGGNVAFDCGDRPHTIVVQDTLVLCNTATCGHAWQGAAPVDQLTVDGGGLVTLSGGGARGIFYANTCDEALGWVGSACQRQTYPHVTFRDLTFRDGSTQAPPPGLAGVGGGHGGGAIAMRGGRLTVVRTTFLDNVCVAAHPDAGGGGVRVTGMEVPARIRGSVFDGNRCANGGAVSGLHAPMIIEGTTIRDNAATGRGASSGDGGNGGGIYFDGTWQDVLVRSTTVQGNQAPEGGPGIFYVSNDRTGTLTIDASTITGNTGQSFFTSPYRSLFYRGTARLPVITGGTVME